jgi:dihydrolipoamide dehydrogenase
MVVGQIEEAVDFLVAGAGPGGYAAALRAAQSGRRVTLIDRDGADGAGGVCLRVGCIPSKALIEVAELANRAREAEAFGLKASFEPFDMARFQAWKADVVKGLTDGVRTLLKAGKVEVLAGEFRLNGPESGVLTPPDGQARFLKFDSLVLATGSRPAELAELPFADGRVLDSTAALALDRVPKSLAVIGAGYIGLELGTAFAKLGAKVTLVEAEARVLPAMESSLARAVERRLKALGVGVMTGARAEGFERGRLTVRTEDGETKVPAECVIVAVGRKPNTDDLGLETANIAADNRGLLEVAPDRRLTDTIAAIGDITPGPALAHKATAEAQVAAEALSGQRSAFTAEAVPAVVFSDPEVATAGLTEAEATEQGLDVETANFPVAASGRARTLAAREGSLQIVAEKGDGRVLGVHIAAPHASELIAEAVLAIEMGATMADLALTIHPHPTMSEMTTEAAHVGIGHPIHVAAPVKR